MQWDKKFKWKWMCCIHFLRQKLFLQLFHLKWNYLLIFFSFTLSEKEKHCSWMHLTVKVLNLEIYLCGIYLRYWKTQFPQNYYYFPSMVYIGYYRNMIIEFTAPISSCFINCKLAFLFVWMLSNWFIVLKVW